ncbi:hemerythrin domain-containing protein [Loktanella sp. DJP18]|uniref:hemerythrin domain-containing protein n=1 Tax=Loktanella sp. DJP18 TaxID=3409788 RepID=UPI003BB591C9
MRGPSSEIGHIGAARFETCLAQQVDLCCALETLADALPSRVDTRAATLLAETLQETLHNCHQMEETFIFPALLTACPDMLSTITRLRAEHVEDEEQACEVKDAIMAFVILQKRKDVEEFGYLLRGLFMALRRHLAFDRDYVLPLYRRTDAVSNIINLPQSPAH